MSITTLSAYAGLAVREATRPKSSGRIEDAHTSRLRREIEPDVERMRQAVSGGKPAPRDIGSVDDQLTQ